MAVTEILGTDSLSSSRVTINDNFLDVQDEIVDLKGLLDPATNQLTDVDITAKSITISGSPGTATLLATTATSLDVTGNTKIDGAIIKAGVQGSIGSGGIPQMPTTLAHSTYFVDLANATAQTINLGSGADGQEIMMIATSIGAVDANAIAAITSVQMDEIGSTLTLRFFVNSWYVVGSHKCTIT